MITEINKLKVLKKHTTRKCKCKFDGTKYNSDQKWNNGKYWCEYKKFYICEKDYIWNPAAWSCKNNKYLASVIDDSVITCDEIIDAEAKPFGRKTKSFQVNLNEKNKICETKSFCILLIFLIMDIELLTGVSV